MDYEKMTYRELNGLLKHHRREALKITEALKMIEQSIPSNNRYSQIGNYKTIIRYA